MIDQHTQRIDYEFEVELINEPVTVTIQCLKSKFIHIPVFIINLNVNSYCILKEFTYKKGY